MTAWSIYDDSGKFTGRTLTAAITKAKADAFVIANLQEGQSAIEGIFDASTQYVVDGEVADREPCPITGEAVGLVVTLHGVPNGATINISGPATDQIVNDDPSGDVEITLPTGGLWRFQCELFPVQAYDAEFSL